MQGAQRRLFATAALAAVLVAAVTLRWPLYARSQALLLGWNSDTAVYGLMAREMAETRRPILLFWGQDYLGTLTSLWTLAASSITGEIGPLALRVGAFAQVAVALALIASVITSAWGKTAAAVAVVWLIAGPRWFFEMTYAPLSAEQMFLMGALILWYVNRQPFTRLTQWFTLGLLVGIGWWAHRGIVFALVPALITIVLHDRSWRRPLSAIKALVAGTGGAAIGIAPLFAGRAQIDQRLYEPAHTGRSAFDIADRIVQAIRTDLWVFLGGVTVGVVVLVLATIGLRRAWEGRAGMMLIGVLIMVAGFWIASPEVYSGATRYLMLALPIVYALAGRGAAIVFNTHSRAAVVAVSIAICSAAVHLYVARMADVAEIAAARRENHHQWRSFDPRPALDAIERGKYGVCYADFWAAYKLEWLSDTGVKFIPYRSVNRTQRRSLTLVSLNVPKCYVDAGGDVQRLSADDERAMRAQVVRAVMRKPW